MIVESMTRAASLLKHDLDELQIDDWLDIFRQERFHPDDIVDTFNAGRRHWEWWPKPFDILPQMRKLRDHRDGASTRLLEDDKAWAVDGSEHIKRFRAQRLSKLTRSIGSKIK